MNIAETLKNAPKGTKLWSTVYGKVTLDEVNTDPRYPIFVKTINGDIINFTKEGKYNIGCPDAECLLFPSKENRDWSTFKAEKQLLPVDTPVMVAENVLNFALSFALRYYAYENKCWIDGSILS